MNEKGVIPVLFGALCIASASLSQTREPGEEMRIDVDYARYRGDDTTLYIEVYYAIPQSGLTYQHHDSGLTAGVEFTLMVTESENIVAADRWLVPHSMADTTEVVPGMNLVGVANVALREGDYILKVIGRDRHNLARTDSVLMKLPVRIPGTDRLVLSDLELASSIRQGEKGSPFYKNTLEVIPNVDGVFSEDQRCYFYTEAYNLLSGDDQSDYVVRTTAFDAIGREVISRERPRKRSAESSVIVDNITTSNLKSGTYTLVISLIDSTGKPVTSTGKKFFVYNPTLGVDSTLLSLSKGVSISIFNTMEEPEIDREFKWCRYESSDDEENRFNALQGVEAKRKFMYEFWRRRPAALREEYLKRVAYANGNFRVLGREGYRTDRGRIYVTYGPPDDTERHPSDSNSRPYEVWSFNEIQGGVIFVFVLRQPGGDYELVHSTHRNELRDDNWERFVVAN